jgi:CheY-like chemotaxis protein
VLRRPRVLLVEDDPDTRGMYRTALMLAGLNVIGVSDGLGALRAIESESFDLVVLDLHLPFLDGVSVLKELAADPHTRHIPVIVVTGSVVDDAVAQATAILRKPCAPDILVSIVEEHIAA